MPLVIISHNAINLERPSTQTHAHVDQTNSKKTEPKETELEVVKRLKKELNKTKDVKRLHRRRTVKGPNPLSCKKSQKKKIQQNNYPKNSKSNNNDSIKNK